MHCSRLFIIFFCVVSIFCMSSCSKPSNVMSKKKMENVMFDIYIGQAIYKSLSYDFKGDEKKDSIINGILSKHNIDQAALDSSLSWYSSHIEKYNEINDAVKKRLAEYNNHISDRLKIINGYTTYDILPTDYTLNELRPTLFFNIDSTKIKAKKLQQFKLKFKIFGKSNTEKIEACLFYKYKDTTIIQRNEIDSNKTYIFASPADSIKNISGYIHLKEKMYSSPDIQIYNISYLPKKLQDKNSLDEKTNSKKNAQTIIKKKK